MPTLARGEVSWSIATTGARTVPLERTELAVSERLRACANPFWLTEPLASVLLSTSLEGRVEDREWLVDMIQMHMGRN